MKKKIKLNLLAIFFYFFLLNISQANFQEQLINKYKEINTLSFDFTQKIGDKIYVFFKDSKDHTYYVAAGNIEDYLIDGLSSLTVTESQNSAGEAQIISTAIQLD